MPRIRTYGLDIDTIRYAQRVKSGSGTTILPEPLKQINKFVVGVKKLGLWNSMVCWPMRSIHNAGTGSTVYSLGGQGDYNVTLANGVEWGYNGVVFSANDHQLIQPSAVYPTATGFTYIHYTKIRNTATNIRLYGGSPSLNTRSYLLQFINSGSIYSWVDRSDQPNYQQWFYSTGYLGNFMNRSIGWTQRSDYSTTTAYVNGIKCTNGVFDPTKPWSSSAVSTIRLLFMAGTEAGNGYTVPIFMHGTKELSDEEHFYLDFTFKSTLGRQLGLMYLT